MSSLGRREDRREEPQSTWREKRVEPYMTVVFSQREYPNLSKAASRPWGTEVTADHSLKANLKMRPGIVMKNIALGMHS